MSQQKAVPEYRMADLPALLGGALDRMPWIHRILHENLLRNAGEHGDASAALAAWQQGNDDCEIPFRPTRLMMHDTTCGPALVDLAAMRSVVAEAGGDPAGIGPMLRVDVSTDHSIAVDRFGSRDALRHNLASELHRNAERFGLMKWASHAFGQMHIHPPGSGIMHTINLERLASVVTTGMRGGMEWAFPDTLIGTDSHTPMINGIGVLGWGVGGLEAESVMMGMPVMLRIPRVVGVRLLGALSPGVMATDLALAITHLLRKIDLDGRFVEFFGPGVSGLSAGTRAVVANMTPEFGGATGYFPIDAKVVDYLRSTGRSARAIALVEDYARRQHLWFDPEATPRYDEVIHFDLESVRPSLAGPHRPQDLVERSATTRTPAGERHLVAIAAITSCTNTSDPRLLVAAGLLARNAVRRGLSVPAWVKPSLAPGSPAAAALLDRAGLLEPLEQVGFAIVAYGCATCIGNSGPLAPEMDRLIADSSARPVAVLSGNRNFPGRVHRSISDSYLASPPLVIAYALAGDFDRSIESDPLGLDDEGRPVFLNEIWPAEDAIDAVLAAASDAGDYARAYDAAEASPEWRTLPAARGELYPWDRASTYLRPPPFVSRHAETRLGRYLAVPLIVLGDDVTTDHISPAGAIPADSDAGRWLVEHGEDPADLNVFSARRGNWEVMLRGLFTNPSVKNLLGPELPPGTTRHMPSGAVMPLWQAARLYAADRTPVVVVAGERYGMGSSRDWAAKGQYLLGARAVLASSFERIHRSNLVNMGILPLELPPEVSPASMALAADDRLEIDMVAEALAPGAPCPVRIHRGNGRVETLTTRAAVETAMEVETLADGGMLPLMIRRALLTAS